MTFHHFNQLHRLAVEVSQSCIFAADTVFLVCQGVCGNLFYWNFPAHGGSVEDLTTQKQYLLYLLFVW